MCVLLQIHPYVPSHASSCVHMYAQRRGKTVVNLMLNTLQQAPTC